MRCPGCGEANEPFDAFCRWCGLPLATEPVEPDGESPDPPPSPPGPERAPRRRRGPRRWRPWVLGALAAAAALTLAVTAGWWFLVRPPATAQSIPDTLGMTPAQPGAPTLRWELPAAEVSRSCRVPGGDTTNTSARRCELHVRQWPGGQLVGTLSKGTAGSMRVSDLFGIDSEGDPTWRITRMSAVCTTPRFDTRLVCADIAHSEVFALDPATGERLWTLPFDEPVATIAQAGQDVYLYTAADAGPTVSRVTSRGRLDWAVRAPQGARLVPQPNRTGPPQPDHLTVLHDGIVHLGPLQTVDRRVWAVDRRTGEEVETTSTVLAVVREPASGDLVPVTRQDDGGIAVGDANSLQLGGEGDQPGLYLPAAMDDRPDRPWILVDDITAPETVVAVRGDEPPVGEDPPTTLWHRTVERPVALCAGHKALYTPVGDALFFSPVPDLNVEEVAVALAAPAVGFACDGTRIIQADRSTVAAYAGTDDGPEWEVAVEGVTDLETSSQGLLLSRDGGTSVALYR